MTRFNKMSINQLGDDIILYLITYFDTISITSFTNTSRRMRKIRKKITMLQLNFDVIKFDLITQNSFLKSFPNIRTVNIKMTDNSGLIFATKFKSTILENALQCLPKKIQKLGIIDRQNRQFLKKSHLCYIYNNFKDLVHLDIGCWLSCFWYHMIQLIEFRDIKILNIRVYKLTFQQIVEIQNKKKRTNLLIIHLARLPEIEFFKMKFLFYKESSFTDLALSDHDFLVVVVKEDILDSLKIYKFICDIVGANRKQLNHIMVSFGGNVYKNKIKFQIVMDFLNMKKIYSLRIPKLMVSNLPKAHIEKKENEIDATVLYDNKNSKDVMIFSHSFQIVT